MLPHGREGPRAPALVVGDVAQAAVGKHALLEAMAQERVLYAHVGDLPEGGELVAERVLGASPEADARGARVQHHVAREGNAALGQPQRRLAGHVAGHGHRPELPAAAAQHLSLVQHVEGDLVSLEVGGVGPDRVGQLLGLGAAHALRHQAVGHVVTVRWRGEAPHVGKRRAGERDADARLGELARLPGMVDMGMRAEERRARRVNPQAHEGAHEARVVVVVRRAGVHDERLGAVAHDEDVHRGQKRLAHEQLDAPDLGLVEDPRAREAVRVQREGRGVTQPAGYALVAGLAGASQRAPSRRSS